MSCPALLEADGLATYYGTSQALFDVSIQVPSRGGVAILGRNGAGKTTLLNTLAGHLQPTGGRVKLNGQDATHMPTEQRVRRGLGHVPQEQGIFGGLTVKENLLLGAMAADKGRQCIDEIVQLFPRLAQRLSQRAGTLSGGERKMLAISRALLGDPCVILLDEPAEGVWHEVIEEIAQRLEQLAQRIAVVIVEQHVALALRVSHYCYVMDRGRVALEGPSDAVGRDPSLVRLLAP
jgi:branched-chain amino acid transport system ATP-binding protein